MNYIVVIEYGNNVESSVFAYDNFESAKTYYDKQDRMLKDLGVVSLQKLNKTFNMYETIMKKGTSNNDR